MDAMKWCKNLKGKSGVLSFVVEEMVINEATNEDKTASIAIFNSHINENEEVIECPE